MISLEDLESSLDQRSDALREPLEMVWRGGPQPSMAKAWQKLADERRATFLAESLSLVSKALGPAMASQAKKLLVEMQVEDGWVEGEDPTLFLDLVQALVSDKPVSAEYVRELVAQTGSVPFRVDTIARSDQDRLLRYYDVVYRLAALSLVSSITERLLTEMGWGPAVLQQAMEGWLPELMPGEAQLAAMLEACMQRASQSAERMVPRAGAGALVPGRPQVMLAGSVTSGLSREEVLERLGHLRAPWRPSFGDWRDPAWKGSAASTIAQYLQTRSARPGIVFDQEHPDFEVHHAGLLPEDAVPDELRDVHPGRSWKPMFSCGRSNTGVAFHSHAASWLCQLAGKKYWWLLPPDAPVSDLGAPWRFLARPPPGALFCALNEGEVLYIPDDWPHATWNLDDFVLSVGRLSVPPATSRA